MVHVGRIRTAFVLDMRANGDYRGLAVPLPGLNGGLPNMDLVNAWRTAWQREVGHRSFLLPAVGAQSDAFSRAHYAVTQQLPHQSKALASAHPPPLPPYYWYSDRLFNVLRFM